MSKFDDIAPRVLARLIADFQFTDPDDPAAIVGNLAHECAGFETMQEERPAVPGSRGGYGWAQWTAQRRIQFEAWCARKGWEPDSFEANYSFLFRELIGTERRALSRLEVARGLEGKTRAFMDGYLRPGEPHFDSRLAWAKRARELLPDNLSALRSDGQKQAVEAKTVSEAPTHQPGAKRPPRAGKRAGNGRPRKKEPTMSTLMIASLVRHGLTAVAGAMGYQAYTSMSVEEALVAVVPWLIGQGLSLANAKKQAK